LPQDVYPVKPHVAARAQLQGLEEYRRLYRLSLDNPEWFWGEQAQALTWFHPWQGVFDADYEEVDREILSARGEVRDVDEGALRAALEGMPCCATTESGHGTEDPLNFVLIGPPDAVFPAFARTGWHVAEVLRGRSALATFWSYFFGSQYRYAPISAIYLFGRRQDLSLQKARETARNGAWSQCVAASRSESARGRGPPKR